MRPRIKPRIAEYCASRNGGGRTFKQGPSGRKVDPFTVDRVLNHKTPACEERTICIFRDAKKREALTRWAEELRRIISLQ